MKDKLVKKAQNGNKEAFNKLILMYKDDLYRIARARIGNCQDDICDIVQETIMVAYSSIKNLKKKSSFKSWLFTILSNNCNDFFRKKYSVENISYESIEGENYLTISPVMESKIEFDSLMEILTEEERTIILLYYEYGYDSNEIAKILNINANTVRSKLFRARNKIANKSDSDDELKV